MSATVHLLLLLVSAWLVGISCALRFDSSQADWNLNQNESATDPLDYWGEWSGHQYTPSPDNWRVPFYTLALDRYANGDPGNDEANGTHFEHDWMSNQFRYGGDARGLIDHLDYIHGMGIRSIYLIGSPFINQPWSADGYSPLDFTLLDHHHGDIADWRDLVDAIHQRGMYVVLDNTMATMGDLIGFTAYPNSSAPFTWNEYEYFWKSDRHYLDFEPGNDWDDADCQYPRFWGDDGYPLNNLSSVETECRASEFSLYGDLPSTGSFPVWQNQLAKYGSVQDRLREWRPDVLAKIKRFSCIQIAMLDLDGFRMDKALQISVDSLAEWSQYQRECARQYGKENFLIIGEVVGTDQQAAIYYGRGRQADQYADNFTAAALATNESSVTDYVRDFGLTALDGTAFHYTIYGAMTRFLGLDGAIGTQGVDFVALWNNMMLQNDFVNANTGVLDPRHLFGAISQDVFRWPALEQGTQRQLLAQFITYLMMPGAPELFWGEEQSFSILDSISPDFMYGRQPMGSNVGWYIHGCYNAGYETYVGFPLGPALDACHDEQNGKDNKNPSHPVRNIIKRMFELRRQFPVLNDGLYLETLSNQTTDVYLPGSGDVPTPYGIWSVSRAVLDGVQDLTGSGQGNQGVWFLYSNYNSTTEYTFDCQSETDALVSPFDAGVVVKNLFYPYDEYTLNSSATSSGCLSSILMPGYGFKAFVPKEFYVAPDPVITGVVPAHDARIVAEVELGQQQNVSIEIHFSMTMDCNSVNSSLTINSTTQDATTAQIVPGSVSCEPVVPDTSSSSYAGQPATLWKFSADLDNVSHGIHTLIVTNASTGNGSYTNAVDRFMFRLGAINNPVVFPSANYSHTLLHRDTTTNSLYITPSAPGADKFRYSTTWKSSWSSWLAYDGANLTLDSLPWNGTAAQAWDGEHVILQFWSQAAGSAEHFQHGDVSSSGLERRWPHAWVLGGWNTWGYDNGLPSAMKLDANGSWAFDLAAEWPTETTINVWGIDPDGNPDRTMQYGDTDADGVLDFLSPQSLSENFITLSDGPGWPHAAWRIVVQDSDYHYYIQPTGSGVYHVIVAVLLVVVPLASALCAVWAFKTSFYEVKVNLVGIVARNGFSIATLAEIFGRVRKDKKEVAVAAAEDERRRSVLIATMEYEIEDWSIKIKIGGLGVMASLMGKALGHQNLIWVVPCVGGVDYPVDTPGEPMVVTVNGNQYSIDVQYHRLRNITFVLLDSPVFRLQSKDVPYPARMDDLDSAIYYSAWNACIAEAIKRFNPDLYHINDYHGSLAPLYLLPQTIPVSLSLHNAEFQGLWSLRSAQEMREISMMFNLPKDVIKTYVQFGEVFNLLHAGASYLRLHQRGFGAVGVSKKYGSRALKRYPIFWGLSSIGPLPNPDPADMDAWDGVLPDPESVPLDEKAESARGDLRVQAQKWAGLDVNPDAQLFVFVGRWSEQKGVDLIADVFPAVLDKHPDVQLMCVGPVIDLYGKFAALKLAKMMKRYPGRVFSKPEFTALPPFIFSGAEFALIPSRDEPFGLVAVEFGRKGALGVGSRVGGLGQMPGWWYTIESMAPKHLVRQFKAAIESALASHQETRALMRARSSVQRFPVAQWIKDLETLQSKSIKVHKQVALGSRVSLSLPGTGASTPLTPATALSTAPSSRAPSPDRSRRPGTLPLGGRSRSSTYTETGGHSGIPSVPATAFSSRAPSPERRTPPPVRNHSYRNLSSMLAPRLQALAEPEDRENTRGSSSSTTRPDSSEISEPTTPAAVMLINHNLSSLTVDTVASGRKDFKLQNVDPFFNDPGDRYYSSFEKQLNDNMGNLSSDKLCVEEYLKKSEKDWFSQFHDAKLGRPLTAKKSALKNEMVVTAVKEDFQLSDDYVPPRRMRKWLQVKVGDWPVYSFLLAFGQIIAANSYQITLLTGQNGQSAETLYIISSIFLAGSIFWWACFRTLRSVTVLPLPFLLYGAAFFLLGMTPYTTTNTGVNWVQNTASGLYAFASASGFLFFTLNFNTEGGAAVRAWLFRACVLQGIQQLYIAGLWYWGDYISSLTTSGGTISILASTSPLVTAITVPIAVLLWAIGLILATGLPDIYHARPGSVPALYASLLRRKVVVWFMLLVAVQNYWLSAPYGRNWAFLWSSPHAPQWAIALLIVLFFVVVWAAFLALLAKLSAEHSWALPLFAIGLGAPRWAQELWGVSGMGLYLPWTGGSAMASALVGRGIWLWLGVLDTLQGVGFGVLLLQTLTRVHMAGALASAQVVGSVFTMLARGTAPDATGPGVVFPNLAVDFWAGIGNGWFWGALLMQLGAAAGFFLFFRKEQLFKP